MRSTLAAQVEMIYRKVSRYRPRPHPHVPKKLGMIGRWDERMAETLGLLRSHSIPVSAGMAGMRYANCLNYYGNFIPAMSIPLKRDGVGISPPLSNLKAVADAPRSNDHEQPRLFGNLPALLDPIDHRRKPIRDRTPVGRNCPGRTLLRASFLAIVELSALPGARGACRAGQLTHWYGNSEVAANA